MFVIESPDEIGTKQYFGIQDSVSIIRCRKNISRATFHKLNKYNDLNAIVYMELYQIQIALAGYKPKIWRRLLIQPSLFLSDFHLVIQIAMGWENGHLHQFIKNKTFYTQRLEDDWSWGDMNNVDYKDLKISDLLVKEKDKIDYEYDFGDSWHHDVILEKILPADEELKHPICMDGNMASPPEDCGGIWGYANLLEILKHPEHEEYEGYLEWLGDEFDPEKFDKDAVNKLLKKFIKFRKL